MFIDLNVKFISVCLDKIGIEFLYSRQKQQKKKSYLHNDSLQTIKKSYSENRLALLLLRNSPDARAQAGIMFLLDRARYHLLPFSGKDQVFIIFYI